jgi:hypothetical protein
MKYVHIIWDSDDNLIDVFDDIVDAIKEEVRLKREVGPGFYIERGRILK